MVANNVNASSVLQPERAPDRYSAAKIVDGDPSTAWGSKRGHYQNEWLEIAFSKMVAPTSIDVLTGYCSKFNGRNLFPLNRRIKRAQLSADGGWSVVYDFRDSSEWQSVPVTQPMTTQRVRLTIIDIYPGSRWEDLHVSELRVMGRVAE